MVIPWEQEKNSIKESVQEAGGTYAHTPEIHLVSHLHKDGKQDDHDGGRDEESLLGEIVDEEHQ